VHKWCDPEYGMLEQFGTEKKMFKMFVNGNDSNIAGIGVGASKKKGEQDAAKNALIKYGAIKGWKRHNEFVLNIIVPVGEIKFVIFDDRFGSATYRSFFEIKLSPSRNYKRICLQPGLWMAFQGLSNPSSILLDIIPGAHISSEADSVLLDKIEYDFKS
jgi:dTDP-4-dehydrorhamnose 3,5-epimerase